MIRFCLTIVVLFLISLSAAFGQHSRVLIYGGSSTASATLKSIMTEKGFPTELLSVNELDTIRAGQGDLLVLAASAACPLGTRFAVSNFLARGGNVVVIGPEAFNYDPMPVNLLPAVDFTDTNAYRILKPLRVPRLGSMEQPNIQRINLPSGNGAGLHFSTKERGMPDAMVQFSLRGKASTARSVLTFEAKGNHYMDLLYLEITDVLGKKWITFQPLSLHWETFAVSFADFIPVGWSDSTTPYPLLDPLSIDSLAMGTNLVTVWKEKPMEFSVGNIALAENKKKLYAPSSRISSLQLPYKENGITLPDWTAGASFLFNTTPQFPGSLTGTDTKKEYDKREDRYKRIIPLLDKEDRELNGRLEIYAGGLYKNAAVGIYPVEPDTMVRDSQLLNSLVYVADFVLNSPRLIHTQMNTTAGKGKEVTVPEFTVTIYNPSLKPVEGKLIVGIEGIDKREVKVTIPKRQSENISVRLTGVPQDFSFKRYQWDVSFLTAGSEDRIVDSVDIERSMLRAFIHLINAQKMYPDGRYSHHYFGDAYGVRAMFAYLDFLKRNPDHLQKNEDLWQLISPKEIEDSAVRFCDMLVQRQTDEGAFPMGYSEHARGYNVADGGQMALALAQLSRYVDGEQRRQSYLNAVYRFVNWSETFYIDKRKSDSLKGSQPEEYKKGNAREGFYGLGLSGRRRLETGPSWVLSDILGAQVYVAYLDSAKSKNLYKEIAERNARFYVNERFSAAGYYQAEALFWTWLTTKDASIKKIIKENLRASFLPPLYAGKINDMYDIGSRSTLRALPLLYFQQLIENTANNRAVLLKYTWSFGSDTFMSSMANLSYTFPKPVHGESLAVAKYAALSALWAMEIIDPGSTLFEGAELQPKHLRSN